jgi:hypothetical protein
MIYSIEAVYPNGRHLPSNSWSRYDCIMPVHLMRYKKITLTETINKLFKGDHDAVFGHNRYVIHGDLLHINLTVKRHGNGNFN